MSKPIFTIIMDTYNRSALLKEAVNSLFRQTYDNIEIILINNGATDETVEYLHEIASKDKRIKLVHFKENQYSPNDPTKMLDTCLNAALKIAKGDYIWYQSDDDLISDNYAEKMISLFEGNSECITAAGLPISIDLKGHVLDSQSRTHNFRPRYMPGHLVTLDHLKGGTMFSAPGTIFTIKREILIKSGGYHRSIELSHILGIVPFGITGFDETAILYWRRHQNQLNKQLNVAGHIGITETLTLLKDWKIKERLSIFGEPLAKEMVSIIKKKLCITAATWFVINLYSLRFRASLRIIHDIWFLFFFWTKTSFFLWKYKRTLGHHLKLLFQLH